MGGELWGHYSVHPELPIFFTLIIGPNFSMHLLLWQGCQSSAQLVCYLPSLSRNQFIHLGQEEKFYSSGSNWHHESKALLLNNACRARVLPNLTDQITFNPEFPNIHRIFPIKQEICQVPYINNEWQYNRCKTKFYLPTYSIMDGSLVSKMWSVNIHGIDISIGNCIRSPMVISKKNSRYHNWDRSQHCCNVSVK